MPQLAPFARFILIVVAVGCAQRPPAAAAQKPAGPSVDSLLKALRGRVLADTTSPAYKELNIMTAPVNVVEISRREADSLRWALQPDSCGLIAVAHLTARSGAVEPSDVMVLAAEWFGTMGASLVWDVAPSPRWDFLAYGTVRRFRQPGDVDTLALETQTSARELRAHAIVSSDSATVVDVAIIEPLRNTCSGDDCPSYAASPMLGGKRVAWSADGKAALLAGREEPPRWRAVDPVTRRPLASDTDMPVMTRWTRRAIADFLAQPSRTVVRAGPYAFAVDGDSIVVRGPDRNGRPARRTVGPGVPVAATRNGEYLLAIRRESGGWHPVIYDLVLFHAMLASSCDG